MSVKVGASRITQFPSKDLFRRSETASRQFGTDLYLPCAPFHGPRDCQIHLSMQRRDVLYEYSEDTGKLGHAQHFASLVLVSRQPVFSNPDAVLRRGSHLHRMLMFAFNILLHHEQVRSSLKFWHLYKSALLKSLKPIVGCKSSAVACLAFALAFSTTIFSVLVLRVIEGHSPGIRS